MKPNILFLFFCCYLFSCNSHRQIAKSIVTPKTDNIVFFAEQAWDSVAKKIPAGMKEAFGFQNLEEINNSSVGEPIRMYYWQDGEMITSNTYRVPILVEGKMVSLLTVSANENMTSDDFGGSLLARNIQLISDEYRVNVTGILRIHSLQSDFLIFEEGGISYFIPVTPHTLQNLSQKNILKLNDVATLTQR